jgi:hypothetical protein
LFARRLWSTTSAKEPGVRYEAPLPRLFRGKAISQAVAAALAAGRKISVYRTYAPNRFKVLLPPAALAAAKGDLAGWAAAAARAAEEARDKGGFYFVGPPEVSFDAEAALAEGRLAVLAAFARGEEPPLKARLRRLAGLGPDLVALGEEAVIGRDQAAAVRVPDHNRTVSRRHARIYRRGGGLRVEDLKSANGTFVNNRKITDAPLRVGDRLGVGDIDFLVEEG